jgi:plastocyanin
MKGVLHNRIAQTLLAVVVVAAVGGIGVSLAAGGSGGAAMAAHAAPAGPKPAATPSTTVPPPTTTAPPPAPVASAPAVNPAPAVAGTVDVRIVNFKFTPAMMTIRSGTTVTWTNNDAVGHTVNFHGRGINSPSVLNQGDKFSHTFSTPGTYAYICDIHPFMHGTIVVTA